MSANPNLRTTSMTLLAAGLTAGVITAAAAGSLGGPLELQDEGVSFVNGQEAATAFPDSPPTAAAPPGQIIIDQMYVQYRIPKNVSAPPIVMGTDRVTPASPMRPRLTAEKVGPSISRARISRSM
jgi:hypothetical protein